MSTTTNTFGPVNSDAVHELEVVPKRHPGRLVSMAILVVVALVFTWSVATNPRFGWDIVGRNLFDETIIQGLLLTLQLTAVAMVIGIFLGIFLAIMRQSANPVIRGTSSAYIGFFRGTPVLVQLIFWYNLAALYPVISLGIPGIALDANALITPMVAAILGLGLNEAAYMSEVVRAGLLSVDSGQREAAAALGLTKGQTMRRIVLPQAMRVIVPPTGNQIIGMLKTTSLVSVLTVAELLYSAQIIYSRTFETIPLLIVASIWYLAATTLLSIFQIYIERHFSRGATKSQGSSSIKLSRAAVKWMTPANKGFRRPTS